jgi:hypothetical protein
MTTKIIAGNRVFMANENGFFVLKDGAMSQLSCEGGKTVFQMKESIRQFFDKREIKRLTYKVL